MSIPDSPVPPGIGIPVIMRTYDGKDSLGSMDVRLIGVGDRVLRALRSLAWCWLFAVITVLVPILHWVLVPCLLLLGPILAIRAFGFDRQVFGGGGACPACRSPIHFPRAAHPDSFTAACHVCRSSLNVQPSANAVR